MSDCIFCKIANKEITSDYVYEDDQIISFRDMEPQAPEHVLIIPKRHIESLDAAQDTDAELLAHILLKVKDIAADLGIKDGYRVVNNCGEDGGQTVKHLHFHLLGKRKMTWPDNKKILIYTSKRSIIDNAVSYFIGFYALM